MSAVSDLDEWLQANEPELHAKTMGMEWPECARKLGEATGTFFDPFWMAQNIMSLEHACRAWLMTLKAKHELRAKRAKEPELCAEVWNTRPVNADACAAATRALCAGTR